MGKHKRGSQAKSFVEDDSKDLAGDTANLISLDDIKRLDPSRSNNDSNM